MTGSETPAETIRRAAKTLRERAGEYVTPGNPNAALAVAEWLDMEAGMVDVRGNSVEGHTFYALKAARAYLGEEP